MKLSHGTTIEIMDTEIAVSIEYTISPYIPEQGPTYSNGGQPAEGGEIEILSALMTIGNQAILAPDWLLNIMEQDETIRDELREAASEDDGPDPDAERDARRDEG